MEHKQKNILVKSQRYEDKGMLQANYVNWQVVAKCSELVNFSATSISSITKVFSPTDVIYQKISVTLGNIVSLW